MNDHINKKVSQGKWIAVYPFGYKRAINSDGVVTITIDPEKSEIVRFIYDLYLSENYSFSMISNEVVAKYKEPIYKSKIEKILKKPFYYGMMKIKNDLYPHSYGSIITKQDFDKVQEISSNRRGRWISKI